MQGVFNSKEGVVVICLLLLSPVLLVNGKDLPKGSWVRVDAHYNKSELESSVFGSAINKYSNGLPGMC